MILLKSLILAIMGTVQVFWTGAERQSLRITLNDTSSELRSCAPSGLNIRYKYNIKLCKRVRGWLDTCESERVITSSFQYNPISNMYSIASDFLGDEHPPRTDIAKSLNEAFAIVGNVSNIDPLFISKKLTASLDLKKYYLSLRVIGECKGEISTTVARISSVLSLGFFQPVRYDSGTLDFDLMPILPQATTTELTP